MPVASVSSHKTLTFGQSVWTCRASDCRLGQSPAHGADEVMLLNCESMLTRSIRHKRNRYSERVEPYRSDGINPAEEMPTGEAGLRPTLRAVVTFTVSIHGEHRVESRGR
jgi:hypothetical protein